MASSSSQASASIIETSLLLCEVIEGWQASKPTGNGSLDWEAITAAMIQRTGKTVLRADLQTVWKYIAYGKRRTRPTDEDAEQVTYSDDEQPFYQPFSAVKRHKVHATAQLQKTEAAKKGSTAAASTAAVYQSQQVLAPTVSEAMRVDQLCKQIQVKGSPTICNMRLRVTFASGLTRCTTS
jgi:hypothetical protein